MGTKNKKSGKSEITIPIKDLIDKNPFELLSDEGSSDDDQLTSTPVVSKQCTNPSDERELENCQTETANIDNRKKQPKRNRSKVDDSPVIIAECAKKQHLSDSPPITSENPNINTHTVDSDISDLEYSSSEEDESEQKDKDDFQTVGKNNRPKISQRLNYFYVKFDDLYEDTLNKIEEATGREPSVTLSGEQYKLLPTSLDEFRLFQKILRENGSQFNTNPPKQLRPKKVTIKGIPPRVPRTKIIDGLTNLGFSVHKVSNLRRLTGRRQPMPVHQVQLYNTEFFPEIFKLRKLCKFNIEVETFINRFRQCYNCQRFNHSSEYCTYPPRCLKCAENHRTNTCQKPRTEPAKCVLCQGPHPANYSLCPQNPYSRKLQPTSTQRTRTKPTIMDDPPAPEGFLRVYNYATKTSYLLPKHDKKPTSPAENKDFRTTNQTNNTKSSSSGPNIQNSSLENSPENPLPSTSGTQNIQPSWANIAANTTPTSKPPEVILSPKPQRQKEKTNSQHIMPPPAQLPPKSSNITKQFTPAQQNSEKSSSTLPPPPTRSTNVNTEHTETHEKEQSSNNVNTTSSQENSEQSSGSSTNETSFMDTLREIIGFIKTWNIKDIITLFKNIQKEFEKNIDTFQKVLNIFQLLSDYLPKESRQPRNGTK